MFNLFKQPKKETVTKSATHTRERVHRFTENEDIRIITGIVNDLTMRQIAKELNVTLPQVQTRVSSLKNKGLRIDRLNGTQQIVSMSILNRNAFKERQQFLNTVEKLINKVVIKRELNCKQLGECKTSYKTWTKGEINTMKYYKGVKSAGELAELFKRNIADVQNKIDEV